MLKLPHKSNQANMMNMRPSVSAPRSSFNRSHNLTTAIYDDVLVPVFCQAMIPGDTADIKQSSFVRMNPTITPIMDGVTMRTHYFFVPNRLLWDNWPKFMGERKAPTDSNDYVIPQLTTPDGGFPLYSLMDYFGLPVNVEHESVSALPLRAYALIYNTWFRSQHLQLPLPFSTDDGPDVIGVDANNTPIACGKAFDYFTSGLPSPQLGPSVMIPSSPTIPVTATGTATVSGSGTAILTPGTAWKARVSGGTLAPAGNVGINTGTADTFSTGTGTPLVSLDPMGTLNTSINSTGTSSVTGTADMTENTLATINALKQAFALQAYAEVGNNAGFLYTDIIRAFFNVISPDFRMQLPEFIGSTSSQVNMHPLAQTSESADTPQGNLSGNGTLIDTSGRILYSSTEHGYIIGLCSFRGDLSYYQGIDREWSRMTKEEFYWPQFANLGEQAVLNKELIATDNFVQDNNAFSYMPRYDEMRFQKSYVTSNMRPGVTDSQSYWKLTQEFVGAPVLGPNFIISQTPFDRVLQVPTQPTFLCDFHFNFKHIRPLPVRGSQTWGRF